MLTQAAHSVLMVRPSHFGFNPETVLSNAFQQDMGDVSLKALQEFDGFVEMLRSAQITVHVFDDVPDDRTTDALFPNNWISFQPTGQVVLYPMLSENRRRERRDEFVDWADSNFIMDEVIDLTDHEEKGHYLEGTGSMVFDHVNRKAYGCHSARTNERLFESLCDELGYAPLLFHATDDAGQAIYHTNVMMCIGRGYVIACMDAVKEKEALSARLEEGDLKLIDISIEQMASFCGNLLEVDNEHGEPNLAMSTQAHDAFTQEQLAALGSFAKIVHSPIPTIEKVGGGSARCMLAGIHLKK